MKITIKSYFESLKGPLSPYNRRFWWVHSVDQRTRATARSFATFEEAKQFAQGLATGFRLGLNVSNSRDFSNAGYTVTFDPSSLKTRRQTLDNLRAERWASFNGTDVATGTSSRIPSWRNDKDSLKTLGGVLEQPPFEYTGINKG